MPLAGLRRLRQFRHALWLMTARDLRQRFTGTLLGPLWLVLQPLFLLLIYTFVFGVVLRVRFQPEADTLDFALYLMSGLLPYTAFQEAVQRSTLALTSNRDLIQKLVFPEALLPVVAVTSSAVTELIGLAILVLAVAVTTAQVSSTLWLLPLLIALRLVLTAGVCWLIAVLAVFFRDLGQVVGMLLTMLFFATPILYPAELVPERFQWVFQINPFFYLVEAYRDLILAGEFPGPATLGLAGLALAVAILGYAVFNRLIPRAKDFL